MTSLRKFSMVFLVVAALSGLMATPAQAQLSLSCPTTQFPTTMTVGAQVQLNCTGSGGQPPYTYSVTGSVPPGIATVANGGSYLFEGAPTTPGLYSFTVTVKDSNSTFASQSFVITVTGGGTGGGLTLTSLSPNTAAAATQFILTLTGTGFTNTCVVYFNNQTIVPTLNAGQLMVTVPAQYVSGAVGQQIPVYVKDTSSGAISGSLYVTLTTGNTSGVVLNSLSPNSVAVGSAGFTLTLNGSGFSNGMLVAFGNLFSTPGTFVNTNTMTVFVPNTYLTSAATVNVTVGGSNPVTFTIGSGSSGTLPVTCTPAAGPTTLNVSYSQTCTASGGISPYTWTVTGLPNGLSQSAYTGLPSVTISGTPYTAQSYAYTVQVTDSSSTRLTGSTTVSGNTNTTGSSYNITSISPTSLGVGSAQSNLTVFGNGFSTNSLVYFNGGQLATTYNSSTQLTALLTSSLLTANLTANITVVTNGVTTNAATFIVGSGSGGTGGSLTISCSPGIGPSTVSTAYSTTCTASGGVAPYSWPTPSNLPSFLSYSTSTGSSITISGTTPSTSLTYNYTVKATDSSSPAQTGSLQFAGQTGSTSTGSGSIVLSSISPTSAPLNGAAVIMTLTGSGFSSNSQVVFDGFPIVTSYSSSNQLTATVPAGQLTFARSVLVSVTTPSVGSSNALTFVVGNGGGGIQISISCSPGVGPSAPNIYYTSSCAVNGGTAPYNWTISSGSLPSGLTLTPSGTLASISGYTSFNGVYSYTLQVTDSSASPNTANLVFAGETGTGTGTGSGLSISTLAPTSAAVGSAATTLTVNGSGFTTSAQIYFSGTPLTTTYVNSTQLTAVIPAANLASAQTITVTVVSSGVTSNGLTFVVGTVTSTGMSISCTPTTGPATFGATYNTTCTVTGGKAPYTWAVSNLASGLSLGNSNSATVTISGNVFYNPVTAGSYNYTLQVTDSSSPVQSASYAFSGSIQTNTSETITSMSPVSSPSGSGQLTLVISGSGFVSGATVVQFGTTLLTTAVNSANQLSAIVPAALLATPGPANVQLIGAGSSNTVAFFVTAGNGGGISPGSLSFTYGIGGTLPPAQTLSVSYLNGATGFSVTPNGTANGVNWLVVNQSSGAIPGSISVGVAPGSLPIGTYTGSLTFSGFSVGTSVVVPVTLNVVAPPALTASPTTLMLTVPTGGSNTQTVKLTSSDGITVLPYTLVAATNNGGNWLSITPNSGNTPGSFTVTATAGTLAPSTYSGSVTVTASGSVASLLSIPITLVVTAPASLSATPTSLSFNGTVGQSSPASQNIAVSASSNATVSYTVATTTQTGSGWLSATPSGTTPGTISVSVNTANLTAGTYTGSVAITAPGTTNSPLSVPVNLVVASPASLTASPTSLTFTFPTGGTTPPAQTLSISGPNGTGTFNYTVAPTTTSGGNWLSTSPQNGTTPGSVSVSVNPGTLATGTYNGVLTLSASGVGSTTVPVTLNVTAAATLSVSPQSLSFSSQVGGSNPAAQSLAVTASGGAAVNYTVGVTSNGGTWLSATASGTTPGTISVSVNAANLAAGSYTGTVTITPSGSGNSPQTVTVTLTITTQPATLTVAPQSLTFSAPVGGSAPATQAVTVSTSNSVTASYSVAANSTGNWLSATASGTTPGTVTVSVNQTGLAVGQYSGSLSISSTGATNTPQTVQVTLNVVAPPSILAVPSTLSFFVPGDGSTPAPQTLTIISSGGNTSFTTSAVSQGGNWLSVSAGGQTPGSVVVTVNPAGLLAGQTYNGAISITAPSSNPSNIQVPVTLTLAATGTVPLQVAPQTVYLSYTQGSGSDLQHVAVLNNGGGTVNFTAQGQTSNCGNWLTVITPTGAASASSPAVLAFNVNSSGLNSQTCRGALIVKDSNANTISVPIYMAISGQTQSVLLSQTAMNFVAAANGTAPAAQAFQILNPGSGNMAWNIATQVLSGGTWLSVSPTSGTSASLSQTGAPISVTVNPQGLAAGVYYGSVQVTSTGAFNSPQSITVAFTVLPANSNPPLQVSPNGVIITGTGGTSDTQTVTVSNNGAAPVSFSTALVTDDGQSWLMASPATSTVPAAGNVGISLSANLTGLSGGLRHGTLRLAFTDGSVQTVDVQLAVSGSPSSATTGVHSCGASDLAMEFLAPSQNFQASSRVAIPLQVLVKDCNGNTLTSSSTGVDVLTGSTDIRLNYIGNGIWAGTWTPSSASPVVSLSARAVSISGGMAASGVVTATGLAGPAVPGAPPYVSAVVNAASFLLPGLVAPGTMVSIFGSGLADGQTQVFSTPFPNTLQGAQFTLRGLPLPLFYVSDGQVNAIMPTGFNANERDQLVVVRDTTMSVPVDLLAADVDPGAFATNQQGSGQGAILVGGTAQLAAPVGSVQGAGPATTGQIVSIFMAGLGTVTNPPADGSPSTGANPSTTPTNPVVTIGGVTASVFYSGLAPGEVGLYQVNAQVPAGVPTGDAVPVVVTMGNGISNTVTMAIK